MVIGIDGRALQFRSWGGVRHYTFELLHALFTQDRENEYHVFYNAWKKIEVPRFLEYPHVLVHYSRWPNKFFNLSIKLLNTPTFRPPQGSLDLLFVPNLNFVACRASTKLVAVVHDLSFEHFPEHFSWRFRMWHRAVNPRALFNRANQVIAVSEHTKGDLTETYGVPQEKISVVYPGLTLCHREERSDVAISTHPHEIASPRNGGARNDTGNYILYFGALEPRKNIEGIIEAYELLNTTSVDPHAIRRSALHLIIAGLSTSYTPRLKERIARSPLHDKITIIENPTEEQKHALYASASLFVYPSFYEGFGFPPLEAMAHGVPVVASSASSVPEVCADAAILVSPWNVAEIKEGLRLLLEDDDLRTHYARAGRERVKQFRWEKSAEKILQIMTQGSMGA